MQYTRKDFERMNRMQLIEKLASRKYRSMVTDEHSAREPAAHFLGAVRGLGWGLYGGLQVLTKDKLVDLCARAEKELETARAQNQTKKKH